MNCFIDTVLMVNNTGSDQINDSLEVFKGITEEFWISGIKNGD